MWFQYGSAARPETIRTHSCPPKNRVSRPPRRNSRLSHDQKMLIRTRASHRGPRVARSGAVCRAVGLVAWPSPVPPSPAVSSYRNRTRLWSTRMSIRTRPRASRGRGPSAVSFVSGDLPVYSSPCPLPLLRSLGLWAKIRSRKRVLFQSNPFTCWRSLNDYHHEQR